METRYTISSSKRDENVRKEEEHIMLEQLLHIDGQILLWIQEYLRFPALTSVMKDITNLGNAGILWILITIVLLLDKKTRNVGYMSALALIGSLIVDNILLKNLVARTRPYEVVDGLKLLIEKQSDYSFPSGHTGSSFASAIVLWKELPKKYGVMALIAAVLIAYSRLYVGVHYPSDVLAGVVIGTVLALVSVWLVKMIQGQKKLVK